MTAHKRIEEIDIARGIAMLLVMAGHLVPFDKAAFKIIFSFHMPFFFLLSGYCTSKKALQQPFTSYVWRKVKHLLIPTLIMNVLCIIVGLSKPASFVDALYFVFISPDHEWFVMVLFVSQILLFFYGKLINSIRDHGRQKILVLVTCGLLPMLGAIARETGIHNHPYIPVKVTSLALGLLFVIIGHYFRDWYKAPDALFDTSKSASETLKTKVWYCIVGFGILLALLSTQNSYVNIANGYWGYSDIYFLLTSCFWTLFLIRIGNNLTIITNKRKSFNGLKKCLALIGRQSLLFYFGHSLIYHIFNQLLYIRRKILYTPMVDLPPLESILYFLGSLILLMLVSFAKERYLHYITNRCGEKAE